MFKKNYLVKINLPGGIVGAGDLFSLVEAAGRARVRDIQLGARQQLFCKVADRYGEAFVRELDQAGIFYETGKEKHPNIVSSYVTEGVFGRSGWVSEGLYKDVLEGFDYRPGVKINLVERGQSFVPFLTGHLNFISSDVNNHWHLMVRRPGTNQLFHWKTVVYSPDIPRVSRIIEGRLPEMGAENWGQRLYDAVYAEGVAAVAGAVSSGPPPVEVYGPPPVEVYGPEAPALHLPGAGVPYYEGFNMSGGKHWLGIYRREELFPLDFLKDVCLLGLQTKIGQLYTTPWKSLLIKGIEEQDVGRWEYVLGKYRINVRHASSELNWQVEDLCAEGLRLKRYLIRQLDQDDVRTEGLTFAIKTQVGSGLQGSIIIRKQDGIRPGQLKLLDRYSIWHTPELDPHTMETVLYRKDLEKEHLYPYIVALCKEFYERQSERHLPEAAGGPGGLGASGGQGGLGALGRSGVGAAFNSFQCRHCLTVYDEQYGDPEQLVAAGTPFGQVRDAYTCAVCGAAGSDYRAMENSTAVPQ
jgi:rubredoxin